MGFYKKTRERIGRAMESGNRERINEVFTEFFEIWHDENISFAGQRAYSLFGKQVNGQMVEDVVNDLYFNMLIMNEEDLLKMGVTDLVKVFRSMVNGPAFVGAMHQMVKFSNHLDLDDLEI